jgi:hypothetical protein
LLALQVSSLGALLLFAAYAAISKGQRGLGRPLPVTALAAVGAAPLFVLLALLGMPDGTSSLGEIGPLALVGTCSALGALVAVPIVGVSMWALRRSFPSGASFRGGALGAASGLAAAFVLTLHCGSPLGGHVALAHGGPLLLATLAGAILGRKVGRA